MPDVADEQLLDQLHHYADGLESCVSSVTADEIVGDDVILRASAHPPARRGRLLWITSAAALVLLVVGVVAIARHDQARQQQPADGTSQLRGDELRDQLVGRTFASTSVLEYGDDYPLVDENGQPGGHLRLTFREETVVWSGGCELSSTAYAIAGDRLVLTGDQVARGQPGCVSAIARQETMWTWAVGMRPMIWLDGGVLTMLVGDHYRIELVEESAPPEGSMDVPTLGELDSREFSSSVITEDGTSRAILRPWLAEDPPGQLSLRFLDERVLVRAGCNSGANPVTVEDGRLVGAGITMEMACGAPLREQDEWFNAFFDASPSIRLVDGRLQLSTASATIELADQAEAESTVTDRPLAGTRWHLDVFLSVPDFPAYKGEFEAYLLLAEDGMTVTGEDGCNDVGGFAGVDGDRVTMNAASITEVACPEPIGSVQQVMWSVLRSESTYDITGGVLRMTNAEGTVTFRAQG